MATFKGIDISKWQGNVDFNKVKADGIQFVIIKAGEKNFADSKFEQYYKDATAAGLSVGAYWYTHAKSVAEVQAEMNACINVIKGKKFDYPIFLDIEGDALSSSKATIQNIICAWCDGMFAKKWYGGIYMSKSPLSGLDNKVIGKYPIWVAQYASKCSYKGSYGMWQYSSTGRVSGISGNVDMDISYVYYPSYIKAGGFNGYAISSNEVAVSCTMPIIKLGSKNRAVRVWQSILDITSTAVFDEKTEKATKDWQTKHGLTADGVVGQATWTKGLNDL